MCLSSLSFVGIEGYGLAFDGIGLAFAWLILAYSAVFL